MRRIEKQRREDSKEADKMQQCSKCGKELSYDARFCASCGTPVESQNSTGTDTYTERKQVFVGAITKCPNCGEQIETNTAKCPACGFVIEKRNVSASLDAFIKKFTSFTNDKAKREFIESYAVPNNKEDIRDLLNYAANQRDKDYIDDASKAYWVDAWNNKCRHIVNQAFDTFGMDEGFSAWLKNYKAGVETSSVENEKLKQKLRSIEAGKQRAVATKKFLKGFGIAVAILAVLGSAGFGIKSCTDKRAAEKQRLAEEEKAQQQELAQLKTEVIELLAKEVSIPKNSVSLGGLLSTYCEVVGDAKLSYRFKDYNYTDYKGKNVMNFWIEGIVSVPVRIKKDAAAAYKKQYAAFIKENFDETERNLSDYKISKIERIEDSIISYNGNERFSMEVLLGAKVGEKIELVDSGRFVDYDLEEKAKIKTAEILDVYHKIKDKLQNPPQTLSLSMTAYLRYSLHNYSKRKNGFDDRSVDIY